MNLFVLVLFFLSLYSFIFLETCILFDFRNPVVSVMSVSHIFLCKTNVCLLWTQNRVRILQTFWVSPSLLSSIADLLHCNMSLSYCGVYNLSVSCHAEATFHYLCINSFSFENIGKCDHLWLLKSLLLKKT